MSADRDDPRCFDAVLLRKVGQIFAEADDAYLQGLRHAAEQAVKNVAETPQLIALVNEYGVDAVRAAVFDVGQARRRAAKKFAA